MSTVATGPRPRSRRLDDHALGRAVGIGPQLEHFRLQGCHLEQLFDAGALLGRGGYVDRLSTPLLGNEVEVGQFALHAIGVGFRPVDLVDGHDDRDIRGPRVVDGLDGLGHHPVVGGHHENHDIRGLGAPGPHGRERLVARGVQEGHLPVRGHHLVGADVLGDAAELLLGDLGPPDGVEERACRGRRVPSPSPRAAERELGGIALVLSSTRPPRRADLGSTLNLSAMSGFVGSSRSFTMRSTPISRRALMTSLDLRRIFSANRRPSIPAPDQLALDLGGGRVHGLQPPPWERAG
jgi:hypothetical protein